MSDAVIDFFDRAYRKFDRYWLHDNRHSIEPLDFPPPWQELLNALSQRPAGYALDLGAGEGSDAIRLARLGFEVDAVEGSAVGAEKIEIFSRESSVRVNIFHCDARQFQPTRQYDVVICNGLLHYLEDYDKRQILKTMQNVTRTNGFNMVFLFSDHDPVPECHRIIDVHPDGEHGIVWSAYRDWSHVLNFEHNKLDTSHVDFPPHRHSHIKILARNTGDAR